MMLDALAAGEELAANHPYVDGDTSRELAEWVQSTMTALATTDRAEASRRLADVHDALRGTLRVCWTLLDLDVDIRVVRRLVENATEAFIASGSYAALAAAGIDKAEEFVTENATLTVEIKRRERAGELGRPSLMSKIVDRAVQEGYSAGLDEAFRRGQAAQAAAASTVDPDFEAHLDGDIDYDDDADLPQALPLRRGMPGGTAPLADAARTTGEEPGLKKARREHDEAAEHIEDDRAGMEPS